MTSFLIEDKDFVPLKGKIAVVTGGSSGIGLATTKLLLENGAVVVSGDLNPSPVEDNNLTHVKTDVTSFSDLTNLFKTAIHKHKRIDHCFANAGIAGRADYINGAVDDNGDLVEPNYLTIDIVMRGCINTCSLAIHYMKKQEHATDSTSSIVITASASSFQRFRLADYTSAKHGVLGFMRGVTPLLHPHLPIRINAISPSWTQTGLVPEGLIEKYVGIGTQTAAAVARSVAILMADPHRHGQLIYSVEGKYSEIEGALLLPVVDKFVGPMNEDAVIEKLIQSGALSSSGQQ